MKSIAFSIIVILISVVVGCQDTTTMMDNQQNSSLTVSLTDGSTNVRLDAAITFTFGKSIERSIAERNIHLISERDMADSLCPAGDSMGHGMMDMGMMGHGMMDSTMMDSTMMNHFITRHNTRGKFQWNSNNTQCTFSPDSMLMPNMQYMIHMGREMMQMMESRAGDMNMMSGHGSGMMSNDMMYHFRTMDTTQNGGGGHGDIISKT